MKKILIFLQILIIFGPCGVKAYEVNTEWIKNWGGNNTDGIKATMVLDDNSVVAVGLTNSNVDGINVNGQDALIIKYDKEGNVIWQKNCGGIKDDVFSSVTLISDGSIIAVGKEENSSSVLPMIVKYDQDGNVIWQKSWGGNTYSQFDSVVASSDGGFIAAGASYSSNLGIDNAGQGDAVIVKFDKEGNVEWNKSIGGSGNDGYGHIVSTLDGGYVATGYLLSTDIAGLAHKGNQDILIVKYMFEYDIDNKITQNGTSTVEQQGSKGIINATPNQGYKIDKILVYDTKGNEVAVTKEENGTYSFELYDDVTVEVTYLKNAENIEIENPQTDDNIMPKVICALLLMLSSCVFYKFSGKKYSN